jgi:hypothetical protein
MSTPENDPEGQECIAARFLQALQQLGWTAGPLCRSITDGVQAMLFLLLPVDLSHVAQPWPPQARDKMILDAPYRLAAHRGRIKNPT